MASATAVIRVWETGTAPGETCRDSTGFSMIGAVNIACISIIFSATGIATGVMSGAEVITVGFSCSPSACCLVVKDILTV